MTVCRTFSGGKKPDPIPRRNGARSRRRRRRSGPTVTFGERTAQQEILINHGIAGGSLSTSRSRVNSHAPTLEANYAWVPTSRGSVPIAGAPNAFTSWIWLEGRGQTRTGMPTTVTAPEIANPAPACPPTQGQDTRLWPVYPDGTFGGSRGSIGQSLQQAIPFPPGGNNVFLGNPVLSIAQGIFDGYHPTYSIASTLSGWADLDGDGLPEFVATPSSIERFAFDFGCTTFTDPARFITTALEKTLDSLFARQPFPASTGGHAGYELARREDRRTRAERHERTESQFGPGPARADRSATQL